MYLLVITSSKTLYYTLLIALVLAPFKKMSWKTFIQGRHFKCIYFVTDLLQLFVRTWQFGNELAIFLTVWIRWVLGLKTLNGEDINYSSRERERGGGGKEAADCAWDGGVVKRSRCQRCARSCFWCSSKIVVNTRVGLTDIFHTRAGLF